MWTWKIWKDLSEFQPMVPSCSSAGPPVAQQSLHGLGMLQDLQGSLDHPRSHSVP